MTMLLDVLRRRWPLILALGLVIGGFGVWRYWVWYSNPQRIFTALLEDRVDQSNSSGHQHAAEMMSPELKAWIESRYAIDRETMLKAASAHDALTGRKYRFVKVDAFEPGAYAEATFARSGEQGDFTREEQFRLPFVKRDGKWYATDKFRDGRDIVTPGG